MMKYSYYDRQREKVIEYFGEYPLMINGHEIPIPRVQDYKVVMSPQDSEKTTRAIMKGVRLHRDILGIVTKVTITYKMMTSEKLNEILGYANYYDTNYSSFNLKFFNNIKNKIETKEFYVTDVEAQLNKFGSKPENDVTLEFVSIEGDV